ncbi:hypothetical protein D1007_06642 [Hordeum vulgare]|nr:hypothetical protein D1007_06642 [Hordeum vulgare]
MGGWISDWTVKIPWRTREYSDSMDPTEILHVCFHLGGEFIRTGPNLQYVGGDKARSDIERDKLSLQEVNGFLKDHIALKESMKFYFLIPGHELVNGLMFLDDDSKCLKMADYVDVGAIADVYVEYHGEEESADSSTGSDFEDEILSWTDSEPDVVMTTAEPDESDTMQQLWSDKLFAVLGST